MLNESISDMVHTFLPWLTSAQAKIIAESAYPLLVGLIKFSIPLAVISFFIGIILALFVALIQTIQGQSLVLRILKVTAKIYVSIIRGTPLLVQLFIIFYALPNVGITLEPLPTAIIAFSLNTGAYCSEILRAGLLSIAKGQWEAGYTIGMTYMQNLRHIILPQAMRVSVPPLSNNFIGLVKETSLASVVLVPEMMRQASIISSNTYEFLIVYTEAAVFYWVVCFSLSLVQTKLEHRFDRYVAK